MAIIEEVVEDAPAPPVKHPGVGKKEKPAFIPADKFEVKVFFYFVFLTPASLTVALTIFNLHNTPRGGRACRPSGY